MARPKEFDRDVALRAGMRVFWRRGFAATTLEDLARAMGIGRQSFYDTFGDKRRCYLDALRSYTQEAVGAQLDVLRGAASPLQTLRALLRESAEGADDERRMGCMAVNALAEFGAGDPEVAAALGPGHLLLEQAFVRLLRDAKARGEVAPALDAQAAAGALLCTRAGLQLHAKAGWSPEALRRSADFAVDQLRAASG